MGARRRRALRRALAAGALLAATLASGAPWARTAPGAAAASAAPPAPASAIDDAGQRITLAAPARRVISLAPGITELLFEIGAGAQVVAASEYSDWPPAARQVPRVARAQGIDFERIAALAPDLIVTWGSGYAPALLDALRRVGPPVYVYEPRSLAAVAATMERLGALTAAPDAAPAAERFRTRLQALRARYAARPPVRVFYQVWGNPVMTLSGKHVVSEVLRTCGARNVFEDLEPLVATVDVESVIAARPEMIVTAEAGAVDGGALDAWRRYPQLPAVAAGQLVTLDADAIDRASARILDATALLCERIEAARR